MIGISGGQTSNATYPYKAAVMRIFQWDDFGFIATIYNRVLNIRSAIVVSPTPLQWLAKYRDTVFWPKMKRLYWRPCKKVQSPCRLLPIQSSSSTSIYFFQIELLHSRKRCLYVIERFCYFRSGIFDDDNCKNGTINHGVLIVGYGRANATDYWIVRNSWGTNWGQNGYILMKRNVNICRIAEYAFLATN